ncbi:NFX1-type zinc finger-containing protein 1-like [Mercenaria mercenaria]|uniref:NFX1-type zinc finger-containing protein 1-like n=1 Tax=Mercenaria mercenaria TaxID=6596 RepID=UPI00234FB55D|nr:NFX1-type zinc finger-containing protein 1-like [Mercenaria mercenaria]
METIEMSVDNPIVSKSDSKGDGIYCSATSENIEGALASSLPETDIQIQKKPGEPYTVKRQHKWQVAEAANMSSEIESETIETIHSKKSTETTGPDVVQSRRTFGSSWRGRKVQLQSWSSKELSVNTRADSLRSSSYGQTMNKRTSQKLEVRQKQTRSDQADWRSRPSNDTFEFQDEEIMSDLSDEDYILDSMLTSTEKLLLDMKKPKRAQIDSNSNIANIEEKRKHLTNESKKQRQNSHDIIQAEKRSGMKLKFSKTLSMKKLTGKDSKSVLTELTKSDVALKDCIDKSREDNDYLELFLDILAKAFVCDAFPNAMIMLYETLKENRFFDALVLFLIDLQDRIADTTNISKYEKVLKDILSIIVSQITRNPSSVTVFSRVYTALGQIINEMKELEDYVLNEEIQDRFTLFSERKKAAEKMLKSSLRAKDKNQPPEDFRIIQVTPGANEIRGDVQPFLRPNKIEGEYEDLDHYLDVQFRLLREDFVGPLREGISEYIRKNMVKQTGKGHQKWNSDIKIYNARIYSPIVTEHGFCYQMKLEMTPLIRRTNWSVSKRLIYGSLVCLTEDEFSTFTLATVVGRDEEDIKRGLFTIQLDGTISSVDLLHKVFKIAETSAYFESYKHVLTGLQEIRTGDMPFEKYIVHCESKVDKPAYLTSETTYDLRPLVEQQKKIVAQRRLPDLDVARAHEGFDQALQQLQQVSQPDFSLKSDIAKCVNILDTDGWPAKECLHLDESQYEAVQTALTKEFVIIQGPPGTGKTYIGLQIARALLHNRSQWIGSPHEDASVKPMLIVCYTNHALDQFLEGIHKFFKGDILRVGGRSKSNIMERCNLKRYRQCFADRRTALGKLQQTRLETKQELDQHSQDVSLWAKSLELYQSEIIHENYLFNEMSRRFYNNLRRRGGDRNSCIAKWLGIAAIIANVKRKSKDGKLTRELEQLFVKVEDELTERRNYIRGDDSEENYKISEREKSVVKQIRKKTIAFFVEDIVIPDTVKNKEEIRKLKTEKDFRRHLKSIVQAKITSQDVMSQDEANRIGDIWRIDYNDRWRLYRMWLKQLCSSIYSKIESKRVDYEAASERYRDASLEEDKEIMRTASVIGMTTSGAAKYQSVLREIEPKIIIVEEAAEVLEAHVVATLSRGCEHLILIGDHKQLRPNPTVHRLAVRYNLNISLFERMVENGIKFNTLELQHRMRPEIAGVIRHIYHELKDHDSVKSYPSVRGISTNMFLIHHEQPEENNEDIRSYSNLHEALFATALCRYLVLQGYNKEQITVLTTYTGQLMCLRKHMPFDEFEGVRVTVVDNYQGEENDFVILSLVRSNQDSKIGFLKTDNRICVALSRAKIGFYVIGNFVQLAANSSLWKTIVEDMKEKGKIGDRLKLYCQNHPTDDAVVAREGKDFQKAPNGGCSKKCEARLNCGHVCQMFCHVADTEHIQYQCRKPCKRVICNDHKCPDDCYQTCRPCQVPVIKIIPACKHEQSVQCFLDPNEFVCLMPCEGSLPCGHKCTEVCGNPHTKKCKVEVKRILPCGHTISIECYRRKEAIECNSPCQTLLKCEHFCEGTCGQCFRGRVHIPCKQSCKRILVCGHECSDFCRNCPPCKAKCENRCIHSVCQSNCGKLCVQCQESCEWNCVHFQCNKLCSEPCDRPRCNEPCQKLLPCNHPCMGLCGEPCAEFFCRKCDIETVTELLFGDEDDPNARFVYLEDCGHNIESKAMDTYMDMKDEEQAVQLKGCPRCKTPIRRCLRYGTVIKESLHQIERVKQANRNNLSVDSLKTALIDTFKSDPVYTEIERDPYLKHTWKYSSFEERCSPFKENSRERYKEHYMKWRCIKVLYARLNRYKKEMCSEDQITAIQNQRVCFDAAVEVINKMERQTSKRLVSSECEGDLILFFSNLCEQILTKRDTFSEQEFEDYQREVQRGNNYIRFLTVKEAVSVAGKTEDAMEHMQRIKDILLEPERYTDERAYQVKQEFDRLTELTKIDGLEISVGERLEIIKSMGLSKGHWFKCPNNHIYAIGECGGAMERGRCPECKEEIGGEQHRLTDGNKLAPEMDGATFAAYSEEANNMANFDLNDLL